ncbi:MAG: VOC family protein [Planctomycetota bacterium]
MPVKPIPDGYHTVTPYLVVNDVRAVIEFAKKAFDAIEMGVMEGPDGRIAHAEIRIGDSPIMLGGAGEKSSPMPATLYLYVEDTDALYAKAIAAGGESLMEPADQFYGDRNAGVRDSQGNCWWIGTHVEDVPPDELKRRAEAAGK